MRRTAYMMLLILIGILFESRFLPCPDGATSSAFAQEDATVDRLKKSRDDFDRVCRRCESDIEADFDRQERIARRNGDSKTLQEITKAREQFRADGLSLKTAPDEIARKIKSAFRQLEQTYETAIKDLTRKRMDDAAARLTDELADLKKRNGLDGESIRLGGKQLRVIVFDFTKPETLGDWVIAGGGVAKIIPGEGLDPIPFN